MLEFQPLHEWPKNQNDAIKIQLGYKSDIIIESRFDELNILAAVDTAFDDKSNRLYAAAVALSYAGLEEKEKAVAEMEAEFPYVPSLLAFREGPIILKALSRLSIKPDLIIYAGHGLAHPRSFGLASHMGLITGIPSIGCARKCLIGDYRMPGEKKGSCTSLFVSDIEVGFVYRTKDNVKPMFISPGHKCSIRDSVDIVVNCLTTFRMPEPLRMAHLVAGKYKNSAAKKRPEGKRNKGDIRNKDIWQ